MIPVIRRHVLPILSALAAVAAAATPGQAQSPGWSPVPSFVGSTMGAILVTNRGTMIIAGRAGGSLLYRSTDQGVSWTASTGPHGGGRLVQAVNGDILSIQWGLCSRSTDDGATWAYPRYLGLEGIGNIQAVERSPSGTLYVGVYQEPSLFSWDNGESWNPVPGLENRSIYSFAFINGQILAGSDSVVFRSTDDGNTWLPMGPGLDTQLVMSLAVAPNGYLFAGTNERFVYRSRNDGESWERFSAPQFDNLTHSVYTLFFLKDGSIVAPSVAYGIYRSTDYGESWERWDNGIMYPYNVTDFAYTANGNLFTTAGFSHMEKLYVLSPVSRLENDPSNDSSSGGKAITIRQTGRSLLVGTETEAPSLSLVIHDLAGRAIRNDPDLVLARDGETRIDLDDLAAGYYYCQVSAGGKIVTRTIVVTE